MDFIIEFWKFLKVRKKYWLIPVILTLLFIGSVLLLTEGTAVSPFIYTIF